MLIKDIYRLVCEIFSHFMYLSVADVAALAICITIVVAVLTYNGVVRLVMLNATGWQTRLAYRSTCFAAITSESFEFKFH